MERFCFMLKSIGFCGTQWTSPMRNTRSIWFFPIHLRSAKNSRLVLCFAAQDACAIVVVPGIWVSTCHFHIKTFLPRDCRSVCEKPYRRACVR